MIEVTEIWPKSGGLKGFHKSYTIETFSFDWTSDWCLGGQNKWEMVILLPESKTRRRGGPFGFFSDLVTGCDDGVCGRSKEECQWLASLPVGHETFFEGW